MGNRDETGNRQGDARALRPGLYFVAVPIGNARDITLRALDVLAAADLLVAEDTRTLRKLMEIHGIALGGRKVLAYHEHNGDRMRPALLQALSEGKSVAYAAEAGTPLISDPGFDLSRAAAGQGAPVLAVPGASAVLTALNVAGLATDRFLFAGFLPSGKAARRRALAELADVDATLVFYESPRRAGAMLADAARVLGAARDAALCRELTKKFEEVRRGTLDDLAQGIETAPVKGEVVIVIGRGSKAEAAADDVETQLREALKTMSVRDAAEMVAKGQGVNKRKIYSLALRLSSE